MGAKINYEFINSQTGNVIAHSSVPASLSDAERNDKLEKKRVALATAHKLGLALIYWQDANHPINR